MSAAEGDGKAEAETTPPEPGALVGLRKLNAAIGTAEAAVAVGFLAALIFVGAFQAIARNFFRYNPYWIDPIIRSSVYVIGLVGGAMAAQSNKLISIDLLTKLFKPRARLGIKIAVALFSAYICWQLYRAGMFHRNSLLGEKEEGIFTSVRLALVLPVCSLLIAFHMLLQAVLDGYYLVTGKPPPKVADEGLPL